MKKSFQVAIAKMLAFAIFIGMIQITIQVPVPAYAATTVIPHSQMSVSASTENGTNVAGNAIDGISTTFWQNRSYSADFPQNITINLGDDYSDVSKVRYIPRTDFTWAGAIITNYKIYVSTDGIIFTQVATGTWAADQTEKTVIFTPVAASYVRLEALAVDGAGSTCSVGEINIEHGVEDPTPTLTPTPTITPTPTPTPIPTPTPDPDATPTPTPDYGTIPKSQMTVSASSAHPGYPASQAIDDNTGTYWYSNSTASFPHSITLNLGGTYEVSKIKYLPRSDYTNVDGIITGYRILLSTNGTDFTEVASGIWPNSITEKTVKITPTMASYLKLEATAGANNRAAVKEIAVSYGIDPTEPVKLTLTPDMIVDEMTAFRGQAGGGIGYATMLVDEQAAAGDLPSGSACTTNWNPAYDTTYYPASAYIDLGRNYKITDIYLNDMSGQGDLSFYTGTPFNWSETPLFTDPLVGYGSWNKHAVNIETRYIRIVKTTGAGMNEMVLYGYPTGPAAEPITREPHTLPKVPVDLGIGANVHFTSDVSLMGALGHVREYHPWLWDEGGSDVDYVGFPNNENKFNPAYYGEGTWNFDDFYQRVKAAGVMLYSCIMQSTPWISGTAANYKDKPISNTEDAEDPASYIEHADKMFQSAARYSAVAIDDSLLKLAPDQQRLTGMNLVNYFEDWNEPDQTFNTGGRAGYWSPYELAAMTSADYDGHEGTMGNTVGIKNADPNAKLVMAGLMDPVNGLDYIKRMNEWFYYNRADHQFAADVVNVHYYCNNETKGISPEAANMEADLKKIVDYSHENIPNREVWLSEFGWDTGIGYTVNYAPSMEVQGEWIVRGYLASFAAGIDRASLFMLHDALPGGTGRFDSCGLVTGNTPKTSWYYVYTLKSVMKDMVFDSKMPSGNPNVYVYRFKSVNTENPTYSYAVWSPTSDGTTVNGYELEIGDNSEATLTTMQEGSITGIQSSPDVVGGKVAINVSERPVFVTVGQQANGLEICGSDNVTMPNPGLAVTSNYSVFFKDQNGAPMLAGPVTWTVTDMNNNPVPSSIMEIAGNGLLTVRSATQSGTYKIKVVSIENSTWNAEKTIILTRSNEVVTKVSISGGAAGTIPSSGSSTYNYQAVVRNQFEEAMIDQTVSWSITDAASQTVNTVTVNSSGVMEVSSTAEPGMYILRAASNTNASKYVTKILILTPDTTAPSIPIGLTQTGITQTTVVLGWTSATDLEGNPVTYDVYQGATKINTLDITGTTYSAIGLTAGTTYVFTVIAKDAVGNISAASDSITVTTERALDTTAPSIPIGLTQTGKTQTAVSLGWTASTDSDGNSVTYDVYQGSTKINALDITGTTYSAIGLTAGTTYVFTVIAKDAAGNISAASDSITVTTETVPDTQTPALAPTPTPTPIPTPTPEVDKDGSVKLKVIPKLDTITNTASNEINKETFIKLVDMAKEDSKGVKNLILEVEKVVGAKAYSQELPADALASKDSDLKVEIDTPLGKILAPSNMFTSDAVSGAANVELTIGIVDPAALDNDIKQKIGDRLVIELSAKIGGKAVPWSNPDAPVTISIDYKPTAEELKNPDGIVVWYIDGSGEVQLVPNSGYDTETGKVTFTTTHLSKYAVAYNFKTFEDAGKYKWAQKQIEMVASKGILDGTSETIFSPGANVTRAEFMDAIIKSLGITAQFDTNFSDVEKTDSYYETIGIAKKLGITNGTGSNKFSPNAQISRQEMSTFVIKAMKFAEITAASGTVTDLEKYADASEVASYAVETMSTMVKEGVLVGSGNKIDPTGKVTRAQTAVIIYKLYYKK